MNFINNWQRSIALSAGAVSCPLDLPDGTYRLTISNALGAEAERWEYITAVVVAGLAGLTRGVEGSSAATWPTGSVIYCGWSAGQAAELWQRLDDLEHQVEDLEPSTPQDLAEVATSGSYLDLSDTPNIPSAPADIGAATAAQGAKADTAVQPSALSAYMTASAASTALADKVDKVAGKGLSDANFTSAEKAKLAGLEAAHYRGLHISIAALEAAVPTGAAGDYADVDAGVGDPVLRYIWDSSDAEWVPQAGSAEPVTAAQVKALYEANADTNVFADDDKDKLDALPDSAVSQVEAETGTSATVRSWTAQRVRQAIAAWWASSSMKTKLDGIAAGATANVTDAQLRDRSTHTGTQAISTITGLSSALDGKQAALANGVNLKSINGQSLLGSGNLKVASDKGQSYRAVTASVVISPADSGLWIVCSNTAPIVLTVSAESDGSWAIPDLIPSVNIISLGAAGVTLAGAAGVTISKHAADTLALGGAGSVATLLRTGSNQFSLFGRLTSV